MINVKRRREGKTDRETETDRDRQIDFAARGTNREQMKDMQQTREQTERNTSDRESCGVCVVCFGVVWYVLVCAGVWLLFVVVVVVLLWCLSLVVWCCCMSDVEWWIAVCAKLVVSVLSYVAYKQFNRNQMLVDPSKEKGL